VSFLVFPNKTEYIWQLFQLTTPIDMTKKMIIVCKEGMLSLMENRRINFRKQKLEYKNTNIKRIA